MKKDTARIAIIGGSGLYNMPDLEGVREVAVRTPFGAPSDAVVLGTLSGIRCAFLPRHGRGHRILPTEINQRANLWALKSLGVEQVIGIAAVGSLKEELPPQHFVFPDQLVDRTRHRPSTFFGAGIVGHVAFADPFCGALSDLLYEVARSLGLPAHRGGTYVCMEGPQFSTKAEAAFHRKMGFSVVGMTATPEAKLAREAELCYANISMVTDYDCWKQGEEVSQDMVTRNLKANAANAQRLLRSAVAPAAGRVRTCACRDALAAALFTDPKVMPKATLKKLDPLIGKYLKRRS
jgi:5'-methylthioadenosine phosphorylase